MHENYIAFTHDGELSTVSLSSADSLKHIRNSKILSNIDADSISVIGEYNSLPDGLFQDSKASSIYIDDRVADIGSFCFNNCKNLQHVHIPCKLSVINNSAFENCLSLKTISLPNSIECLENNAFDGCISLLSIDLQTVKSIGNSCFSICTKLTCVNVSDKLDHIGYQAFEQCSSLVSIDVKDADIDFEAFVDSSLSSIRGKYDYLLSSEYCKLQYIALTVVDDNKCIKQNHYTHLNVFGTSCTSHVPYAAFEHRHDISSLTIDDNVVAIDDFAFHCCTNLKSVKLPASLKHIGKYAFSSCYSLSSVLFPNTLTCIDTCAFAKCFTLADIVFPFMLDTIGLSAFEYCFSLSSILFNGNTHILINAFNNCLQLSEIIAYSKLTIDNYAFPFCFNLQSVLLKKQQFFITYSKSFYNCSKLNCKSFKQLNQDMLKTKCKI